MLCGLGGRVSKMEVDRWALLPRVALGFFPRWWNLKPLGRGAPKRGVCERRARVQEGWRYVDRQMRAKMACPWLSFGAPGGKRAASKMDADLADRQASYPSLVSSFSFFFMCPYFKMYLQRC